VIFVNPFCGWIRSQLDILDLFVLLLLFRQLPQLYSLRQTRAALASYLYNLDGL
jgi:hypothetical protein